MQSYTIHDRQTLAFLARKPIPLHPETLNSKTLKAPMPISPKTKHPALNPDDLRKNGLRHPLKVLYSPFKVKQTLYM